MADSFWTSALGIFAILYAATNVRCSDKIHIDGDIMFGGLFPMHEKGTEGSRCGAIKREKGIQRVEAMLYAIQEINRNSSLLPNITVGVHILDTCSFATYALEQTMDFIKVQLTSIDMSEFRCKNGDIPLASPLKPVAGVIGAASSTVSIMVANILRLFKIPQISYASTAAELSDKSRFEYFSRVVPPDSKQAKAMVDICHDLGWTYVMTLADEGNYGEKGIAAFKDEARAKGVCIAESLEIPHTINSRTFENIVDEMLRVDKASVIIMFINEDNSRSLLRVIKSKNITRPLTFLASDSWGAKIHPVDGQEETALGAVTLLPKRRVVSGFDDYFLNLTANNHDINPWYQEYVEDVFNCSFVFGVKKRVCTGTEVMPRKRHRQEGLVQFVVDSVFAMAHAVHDLFLRTCPTPDDFRACAKLMPQLAGKQLLTSIRNVSFTGITGAKISFDEVGDGRGFYDVYQYQMSGNKYNYVRIGEWNNGLQWNVTMLKWRSGSRPESVCSQPCPFGYIKNAREDTCCWFCTKCGYFQILRNESTCEDCPPSQKPDRHKRKCIALPLMNLRWDTVWALIPVSFSSLGIIATIFVFAVFLRYNTTPVIMASGRELCYILLIGIFLSYALTFIILARPTVVFCTIKRLVLGMSLCLVYAAMLTKTNRIYRIFNRGVKAMVKRPSYTSPKSQIIICIGMVSVQVVGSLTWLGFEKPDTVELKQGKDALVLKCKTTQLAIIISLSYNILLIIFCTVYAFKTRKIPQNFNEAKYIAFTMYSTCIVWLAFIPIYFGANSDFKIELTSMCMCVSISATVALVCLFAPKVYIVLFQPHKNVRQMNNTCNSSTNFKGPQRPCISRQHNKLETCVTYNGSAVSSDIQRAAPEVPCNDSLMESSCDEGVAMTTPSA